MAKIKIINLTVDDLICNSSDYLKKNSFNDKVLNLQNNFNLKYKHLEHFISTFYITIYVNDLNKANTEFSSKDILYIENISKLFILKLYSDMNTQIKNQFVIIIFIEDNTKHDHDSYSDNEINKSLLLLEETAINIPFFIINSKTQFREIEEELILEQKYYVKNARKSVFNTLYSETPRVPYRLNNSDCIMNISNISNISDKYSNIKCPFCGEKFEINIDSIDNVITIEKQNNRISFNCLHKKNKDIKKGKFYINPIKDYSLDMSIYSSIQLQYWFLFNFKLIVKKESTKDFN